MRAACACLLVLAACGPEIGASPDFSHRDLALDDRAVDLSVAGDLAGEDFAVSPPVDLAHVTCDLGAVQPGLWIAAVATTGGALYAARYSGGAWTDVPQAGSAMFTDVTLSSFAGVPLEIARQSDSTLAGAFLDSCTQGFQAPGQLFTGASTSLRAAASGGDVLFKGSVNGDRNLYHTRWTGSSWSPAVQQTNLTTLNPPTALAPGGALHTVFTGTDSTIYDGIVLDTAGGGTATAYTGATTAHEPAAVVTSGKILVVFTGMDTNLYATGGPFPTTTPSLCMGNGAGCVVTSNLAPVLALDASSNPIVAYVGKDPVTPTQNYRVYTSTLTGTQWSLPVEASSGEATNLLPALAAGVGGDVAELVWVRASDGQLRHARLTGAGWQPPQTIKAQSFQSAPSAIVLP
jgi:hypothetical protein